MSKRRHTISEQHHMPNLVAKNAFKFNKAHVIPDKRQYKRKAKHQRAEPFVIQSSAVLQKAPASNCRQLSGFNS
jgi:hypothetical protein